MRRLSLVNLETLCWIARLGTFTAAAQRLNTTQPAISKRVKELEQALRVTLFHRQGRKMELTIQGRDLVQRSQPLLERLEDVVVSLDNPGAATGIIRMGVGEIVAVTWFAVVTFFVLNTPLVGVHVTLSVPTSVATVQLMPTLGSVGVPSYCLSAAVNVAVTGLGFTVKERVTSGAAL